MRGVLFFLPFVCVSGALLIAVMKTSARRAWAAIASCGVLFLAALWFFKAAAEGSLQLPLVSGFSWFDLPYFETAAGIYADGFSAAAVLAVASCGFLCALYAAGEAPRRGGAFAARTLFSGAALGALVAGNLLWLFVFWQMQTLAVFLACARAENADGGRELQTILAGSLAADFALLAAALYALSALGTVRLAQLFELCSRGPAPSRELSVFCALVMAAVFIKSGQFPFSRWLKSAAERGGPAFAALLVSAGIFSAASLPARLYPLFAAAGGARLALFAAASASAALCAVSAATAKNVYSAAALAAAAQAALALGALGAGIYAPAVFHLFNCALLAALLMFCAGALSAAAGSPRFAEMSGLKFTMPVTQLFFIVCALALCGLPPLSGFYSLSKIIAVTAASETAAYPVLLAVAALCALSAASVGARAFRGNIPPARETAYQTPPAMHAPMVFLAVAAFFSGWALSHNRLFSLLVTPPQVPAQDELPFLPVVLPYALALAAGAGLPLYLLTGGHGLPSGVRRVLEPLAGLAAGGFGSDVAVAAVDGGVARGMKALGLLESEISAAFARGAAFAAAAPRLAVSAATAAGREFAAALARPLAALGNSAYEIYRAQPQTAFAVSALAAACMAVYAVFR
ncbi:MAG: proton-conducting transporter membrane subunit [Elusimicrobiales bacterium]|nr:proton-conducting transporter membrane subunit [Elusimicrobiales bacterium]